MILLIILTSGSGFIENNLPPNLVLWNAARNKTNSKDIADFVKQHEAEVYIFIEFDKKKKKETTKFNLDILLPDHNIHRLSGAMAVLVKNEFKVNRIDSLNDSYNYFNIVEANGIKYAIVDIGSWPLYNRAKPFDLLHQLILKYDVDIIAGDFNTPYNSVHFEEFFQNYNCGNTEMKHGRETWPSCFPLVSLDHILVSKKFKIKSYKPEITCLSDHYPLLLNYDMK